MNTPLQSTGLNDDAVELAAGESQEEVVHEQGAAHIHLPNPSYWPILVGASILIIIVGILVSGSTLVLLLIGFPLLLITMLGWGLENPNAPRGVTTARPGEYARSYAEAATTGKPTVLGEIALREAEDVVEQTVTISSTAWSAHPVKVFVEREGVVLSLYGKVELEAQKEEVEAALRKMPGVIDVLNFLVAEDELLNAVNRVIESLKAAGKLEGAQDISALVENYIVSLYGEVPTPEMKYLL